MAAPSEAVDKRAGGGRRLIVFKALTLLALLAVTAYGMIEGGLYFEEQWLPVAAGILGFSALTLFFRNYYLGVPKVGWALIALLGVLVLVKGLSMFWTIGQALTIQELLRSAMYLAVFAVALASVSYRRQAAPLVDAMSLIVAPLAGYGLLQKINPAEFPIGGVSPGRVSSSLEYANTFAMVAALGIMLALARMGSLRNPLARATYAVLVLVMCAALYFTLSRGGFVSLGLGVAVFFVLCSDRLQNFANLLLISAPVLWLVYRTQDHPALYDGDAPQAQQLAAGSALLTDLIVAAVAAFLLQLVYSLLARRYSLQRAGRRLLGALAVALLAALVLAGGYAAFGVVSGAGGVSGLFSGESSGEVQERLTSLDSLRYSYWQVGMEAWRDNPLTGTGAGTFQYTWLQERPNDTGVKQIHNLYLEQGTETGVFAFAATVGFAGLLTVYTALAALRSRRAAHDAQDGRATLLAGMCAAIVVYLSSSALEWHWYLPASTMIFFILAAVAVKYASSGPREAGEEPEPG